MMMIMMMKKSANRHDANERRSVCKRCQRKWNEKRVFAKAAEQLDFDNNNDVDAIKAKNKFNDIILIKLR